MKQQQREDALGVSLEVADKPRADVLGPRGRLALMVRALGARPRRPARQHSTAVLPNVARWRLRLEMLWGKRTRGGLSSSAALTCFQLSRSSAA